MEHDASHTLLKHTLRTAALGAAFAAASLLAQQVQTDYDQNARFENFRTFSFAKIQTSDSLYEQRLRDDSSASLHQHAEKNVKLVQKTVDKIFDHFPPKHPS